MKLNVLFITRYMGSFIEKSTYYLANELDKLCNLTYWYEDGNLPDIIAQLPQSPDFILFNDQKPDYCPWIRNIDKVTIPKGALVHDMHYRIGRRKKMYQKNHIEHLFVQYRDAFLRWYPEFKQQMIWLPHHVPGHIFTEYNLPKEINLLMLGSMIEHLYPLRVHLFNTLSKRTDFLYVQHPGYRNLPSNAKAMTGENYAKLLNRAKIFLTCDSIYKYPVLKYFESLACGTLLLASGSKELQDLGFIDGETFIEINDHDVLEKVNVNLKNESRRNRIVSKGKRLIQQKHTTEVRAKELIGHIERLI
ncbi:glycosyltransferase [Pseudalkalibacillus salsuginis]|uniref:glycosyltransferase n=1 Tax=Pseudalkalibacillus salsuginis TaxID=2910972 RepID=UPI001F4725B3|nr:glycosyltransferase [Pseudalkalibacillus salsuginis]MCF6409161.1 glycosyltransferase [Pseudalkalibacillus salsuginis]